MECFGSRRDAATRSLYYYPGSTFVRDDSRFVNPVQFDIGVEHQLAAGGATVYVSFPIGLPINANVRRERDRDPRDPETRRHLDLETEFDGSVRRLEAQHQYRGRSRMIRTHKAILAGAFALALAAGPARAWSTNHHLRHSSRGGQRTLVQVTNVVVIGVDIKPSTYGVYVQASPGGAYSGILAFTQPHVPAPTPRRRRPAGR